MTAPIAKGHLEYMVANRLAYSSPAVEGLEGAVPEVRPSGLRSLIAGWAAALMAIPRRRAVLDELSLLSDRELADVGLSRADLTRVFDPAFAASRQHPAMRYPRR